MTLIYKIIAKFNKRLIVHLFTYFYLSLPKVNNPFFLTVGIHCFLTEIIKSTKPIRLIPSVIILVTFAVFHVIGSVPVL